MPRTARNDRIETRTARLKLKVRPEPHWFTVMEGRALGYRRLSGGRSGRWVARRYDPVEGRSHLALGTADDHAEANGVDVLTYAQAMDKAAAWFADALRKTGRVSEPLTVNRALDDYLTDYAGRGGKAVEQTCQTIDAHIRPTLGNKLVADLTATALRSWHQALATAPARLRSPRARSDGSVPRPRKVRIARDADGKRARRASANRVLTVLRAALNHAYREGNAKTDEAWRRVKPFKGTQAARIRYLNDDEARRLINACAPDFRALVHAASLTGMRYGELAALLVGDVDLTARIATVRQSKAGKPRTVILTDEATELLRHRMMGRSGKSLVLARAGGEAWGKSHQHRPLRDACAHAAITPPISFHGLRHSFASRLAMRGVPMAVIATALGNSEAICARHYAHLAPGYVADTVRLALDRLAEPATTNLTQLRRPASGGPTG